MAMNKAEKEQFELLEIQNRRLRAMNWPSYPVPQPITQFDGEVICYMTAGGMVKQIVTDGRTAWDVAHKDKSVRPMLSGWQVRSQSFYRTALDALKAHRLEMTQGIAAALAAVDEQIERMEIEERSQFMREYRTAFNTGGRDD